jgi:hypothetical protein
VFCFPPKDEPSHFKRDPLRPKKKCWLFPSISSILLGVGLLVRMCVVDCHSGRSLGKVRYVLACPSPPPLCGRSLFCTFFAGFSLPSKVDQSLMTSDICSVASFFIDRVLCFCHVAKRTSKCQKMIREWHCVNRSTFDLVLRIQGSLRMILSGKLSTSDVHDASR